VRVAEDETLSWRAIKPGHRVLGRDGEELGTVHRVLADEGADIFHGVSLRHGLFGPEAEITADRIERITADSLHTSLVADGVASLPVPRDR
jgi:hypothetical protein